MLGSLLGRALLFAAALWIGCSLGLVAIAAGLVVEERTWRVGNPMMLFVSPLFLFSYWMFLNVPFLLFAFIHFIRSENAGAYTWATVLAVQSLMVMAGWAHHLSDDWPPIVVSWLAWAVLLAMTGSAVWLLRQWSMNRWACQLAMVQMENAQRISEREKLFRESIRKEKAARGE